MSEVNYADFFFSGSRTSAAAGIMTPATSTRPARGRSLAWAGRSKASKKIVNNSLISKEGAWEDDECESGSGVQCFRSIVWNPVTRNTAQLLVLIWLFYIFDQHHCKWQVLHGVLEFIYWSNSGHGPCISGSCLLGTQARFYHAANGATTEQE